MTKIVASVIKSEYSEPFLKPWVGLKVSTDPKVKRKINDFLEGHHIRSVSATDGNIGCPHEEGIDFPTDQDCPFWGGKQGGTGKTWWRSLFLNAAPPLQTPREKLPDSHVGPVQNPCETQ